VLRAYHCVRNATLIQRRCSPRVSSNSILAA
jgi:hypothetical protein